MQGHSNDSRDPSRADSGSRAASSATSRKSGADPPWTIESDRAPRTEAEWGAFMDAYLPLMWSLLRRRFSLGEYEAEEVVADACAVIIRRVAVMPGGAHRSGWIASITCWSARGVLRRRRVATESTLLETLPEPGVNAPPEIVADVEAGVLVRAAVASLPDRDRTLIEGRYFVDPPRTHAEQAERLGVSVNSIGSLLARATRRLAQVLADRGLGPADLT